MASASLLERMLAGSEPLAVALALACAVAVVLAVRLAAARARFAAAEEAQQRARAESAARIAALEDALDAVRDEAAAAHERIEGWIGEARAAQARVEEAERRLGDRDAEMRACVQAAQAAALGSVGELTGRLVEEHRREGERLQRAAEERLRVTGEDLAARMQQVALSVAALDQQVDGTRQRVETVWRALSSPGGAGRLAEVGLENLLRQSGLEPGRDFLVQRPIEGARLRPDAIVFLPGDAALVIDCKASKHLFDLAAAEGVEAEADAYQGLARTMRRHLRALAHRDYRAEVAEGWRRQGRAGTPARCVMVMYLPNEGALEKLARADPGFRDKARALEIALAGPEALACLITFAALQLDAERRADNHERIAAAAQALIDAVSTVLEHLETAGRGLRTAAESYAQATRQVNGRLLPRLHQLVGLGIRPTRGRALRNRLPGFEVVALAEGEAPPAGPACAATDAGLAEADDVGEDGLCAAAGAAPGDARATASAGE